VNADPIRRNIHLKGGRALGEPEVPRRVPHGFHGNWVPDRALAAGG